MHSLLLVVALLGATPDTAFLLEWMPPERPLLSVTDMEALCTKVLEGGEELDASTRAALLFRRAKLRGENSDRLLSGIDDLELAHKLDPGDLNISAAYALAQRIRGGTSAEFQAAAQHLVDEHPTKPHGHFLLGRFHYHNDAYRSAIAHFDKALECDKGMTSVVAWRAVCHFNLNDDDAALEDVVSALQMRPMLPSEQSKLYMIMGSVYARRERYGEAIPILNLALASHADTDTPLRSVLWRCFVETGRHESSLRVARDDVRDRPKDAVAQSLLALSLAHAHDLDGALRHMAEALDLDPHNRLYWKYLGRIHAARGSFPDAIHAFLKGRPLDAETGLHAALVYSSAIDDEIRDGKKAVRIHEAAVKMSPIPPPLYLNLVGACCYAEAGDFDKAVTLAKAALKQSPKDSTIEASAQHLLNLFEKRQPYRLDRDRTLRPFDLPVLEHILPKLKPVEQ